MLNFRAAYLVDFLRLQTTGTQTSLTMVSVTGYMLGFPPLQMQLDTLNKL